MLGGPLVVLNYGFGGGGIVWVFILLRLGVSPKAPCPTAPRGHNHMVTTLGKSRRPPQNLAELEETPAETSKNPSERHISSESLAEGCAPLKLGILVPVCLGASLGAF